MSSVTERGWKGAGIIYEDRYSWMLGAQGARQQTNHNVDRGTLSGQREKVAG